VLWLILVRAVSSVLVWRSREDVLEIPEVASQVSSINVKLFEEPSSSEFVEE